MWKKFNALLDTLDDSDAYQIIPDERWHKIWRAEALAKRVNELKTYVKSEKTFEKRFPEWFAVRGSKLKEFLKSDLEKLRFRKKFFYPPKMEDVYVKWLLAFQMLGCATWQDMADFSGERRDGMCAESDFRNTMLGAGWIEVVGEQEHRYKNRPIYQITEAGAEVVQYAVSH